MRTGGHMVSFYFDGTRICKRSINEVDIVIGEEAGEIT